MSKDSKSEGEVGDTCVCLGLIWVVNIHRVRCVFNDRTFSRIQLSLLIINSFLFSCKVKAGADVNASNKDGTSPLHYLVRKGPSHTECVLLEKTLDLLLNAGANLAAVNKHYETPLHNAVMHGNVRVVKALIRRNASCEAR